MLKLTFTPEVIEALRRERFHHPHPHVQLKMEVLYTYCISRRNFFGGK